MIDQEHCSEDVRRWALQQTKKHVAYLKYVRTRGFSVDDEQIAAFEKEILVEEAKLGRSPEDTLDESDIAELQERLAFVDLYSQPSQSHLKFLVLRRQHTRVRMRPEKNHQRPHFHIEYKREFAASYAVDTLQRLAGYVRRKYEEPILEWAATKRKSLAATWLSLSNGEDVRELVIVAEED